jgi:hypothetical protein
LRKDRRSVRYRRLTKSIGGSMLQGHDYTFGKGRENFWIDVPDAVGQAVLTRLKLETGQWFLDTQEGTPWMTKVMGKYTGDVRDPVIHSRVLDTPGVETILSYSSTLDRETRGLSVSIVIDTIYGRAQLNKVLLTNGH